MMSTASDALSLEKGRAVVGTAGERLSLEKWRAELEEEEESHWRRVI